MSATTNLSPILIPAAPLRGNWRGRLAGWLARMATTRRQSPDDTLPTDLSTHLSRDMGLPSGPSHEDQVWGAGGLMWR